MNKTKAKKVKVGSVIKDVMWDDAIYIVIATRQDKEWGKEALTLGNWGAKDRPSWDCDWEPLDSDDMRLVTE